MEELKIFLMHEDVSIPQYATLGSACFDLAFNVSGRNTYNGYNSNNQPFLREFSGGRIVIMPGDRILVPTGIRLSIPLGYSVRVHARSGLSLKQGLVLANAEGVIDSDYVDELFVMLINVSDNSILIANKDRVAQAELVPVVRHTFTVLSHAPEPVGDRTGGLGSTAVAEIVGIVVKDEDLDQEQPVVRRGPGRPRKNPVT